MNSRRLVLRSLRFHRRTHLAALATAAVVAAVITAALGVGDSVRAGLRSVAAARLGGVRFTAHADDRLWRASLARELGSALDAPVSACLVRNATLALPDGTARIADARAIGADPVFWSLSPSGRVPLSPWPEDGVALNETAAARLGVAVGDPIVIRVERPSPIPRDAHLAPKADAVAALFVEVAAVLGPEDFGSFSLAIGPAPPPNVYLPLDRLQAATGAAGRADTLLAGGSAEEAELRAAAARLLRLEDAGLFFRDLGPGRGRELASRRILLEPAAADAALSIPGAEGVLTWLVNEIRAGDRSTPYSLVAALPPGRGPVPAGLSDTGIVVNSWLAGDLGVREGDDVALDYYQIEERGGLAEYTLILTVEGIVPIEGAAADRTLMPDFPGLTGAESCRDWDPGFEIDLSRIRDRDEQYWAEHGGTPKAFVTLRMGQSVWGSRFGKLTAVRFPPGAGAEGLETKLLSRLDPAAFGLSFVDLRAAAAAARRQGMDFGELFLGFSGLLVLAALLLMGLVVALNVEMRRGEIATLLAVGFPRRRVRRLLAAEHALVALAGGVLGVGLGVALESAALAALGTVWHDVAGSVPMAVVVRPGTAVAGALGGAVVSVAAAWLVLARAVRRSLTDAFARGEELAARIARGRARRCSGGWIGLFLAVAAVTIAALAGTGRDPATSGAFFGSGLLLLAASISFLWRALVPVGTAYRDRRPSARGLALRNLARRRGRSVATVGVLAFGVFMFLGVTVFRRDRLTSADDPRTGTGGFALVGESSVALTEAPDVPGGRVVGLRVRAGDDASCRSLTRAQSPVVVGVDPTALAGRFTFVGAEGEHADPWEVLSAPAGGAVPAVIDQATLWTLGKGLGDRLALTDDAGRSFDVEIAGVIDNAVLHGVLVVSESAFVSRFPSEGGYRRFLVEAFPGHVDEVRARLSRRYEDEGLALERSEVVLNRLNAAENTYLGIFQALGGIGLLLGSAGLALVVARNVVERRGELALLRAVGFTRADVVRLVAAEHTALLALGLLAGLAAAALSLVPAFLTPGAWTGTPDTLVVLLALFAGGLLWTRLAARVALRGPLLEPLRDE